MKKKQLKIELNDAIKMCDKFHIERDIANFKLDIAIEALNSIAYPFYFSPPQPWIIARNAKKRIEEIK
jgi:hypothetical protein